MKKDKLLSLLQNIASLQAIPADRQTPTHKKAIVKMQVSIGQCKLMRASNGSLPQWWIQLEKRNPLVRQQVAACVAAVRAPGQPGSAQKKTVATSKRIKASFTKDVNELSLEDAEDAMGLPRGTLEVCMDAD